MAAQLPRTKGRVIFRTNYGDVDIELFPDQAPKAVRNWVQLCMEGYYNGCIFHRIIPGFMMQGGDPTGTGKGGESIWGHPFEDEFHSRLRFNQRGLVAMANAGKNDNGSQFFITFDRCEWLNNKHTIFGTVAGDTFYNVQRMAELDTDESDRPLYPPVIEAVEVIWNPFEDIVPRQHPKKESKDSGAVASATDGVPGVRNESLLSFGGMDDEEDEEDAPVLDPSRFKIRSNHDVDTSGKLSKDTGGLVSAASKEHKEKVAREQEEERQRQSKLQKLRGGPTAAGSSNRARKSKILDKEVHEKPEGLQEDDVADVVVEASSVDFAEQMRQRILERQRQLAQREEGSNQDDEERSSDQKEAVVASLLHFKSKQRAKKLAEEQEKKRPLSYLEEQRAKYLAKKRNYASREKYTLEKLQEFQSKLKKLSQPGGGMSSEASSSEDDDSSVDSSEGSGDESGSDSGSVSSSSSSSSVDKSIPPWERTSKSGNGGKKRQKKSREKSTKGKKRNLDLKFLASHALHFTEVLSNRTEMPGDYTVIDPRGEIGDEDLQMVEERLKEEKKARWEHASLEELSKPQRPLSELEIARKREEAYRELKNPDSKRRWTSPEGGRGSPPRKSHKESSHRGSRSRRSRSRSRSPRRRSRDRDYSRHGDRRRDHGHHRDRRRR